MITRLFATGCLSAALCAVLSCTTASRIRELTYPPDFRYYDQKEVHSTMWEFARNISKLDQALQGNTPEPELFQKVQQHLVSLEELAIRLRTERQTSTHPMLSRNLPLLIEDIGKAKNAAAETPRNYIPANRISASCRYCHIK